MPGLNDLWADLIRAAECVHFWMHDCSVGIYVPVVTPLLDVSWDANDTHVEKVVLYCSVPAVTMNVLSAGDEHAVPVVHESAQLNVHVLHGTSVVGNTSNPDEKSDPGVLGDLGYLSLGSAE